MRREVPMETQEIVVLDEGLEVPEVAASAVCCKTGPKTTITEPGA